MNKLLISVLVAVLSFTLLEIPATGVPANPASIPLGSVLDAERAQLGADITFGGATIYDGDRLETQEDGILRVRLGKSQMDLLPSTTAEVHRLSNGYVARLFRGTLIASSPSGQTFQLLANGATIRPIGMQATAAQVIWVNSNELLLTCILGAIQVSYDGNIKTIEAGNSVRMEVQPEVPGPPGQPSRKRAKYFWIVAGSIGTAIGIWRALESPSCP
ncbi:MAG: hypothetical protein JWN92_3052 [Candidatus Acidoferrum typicum]|nr:hypothetical protein [Candidatus Acidoferrum typicum]